MPDGFVIKLIQLLEINFVQKFVMAEQPNDIVKVPYAFQRLFNLQYFLAVFNLTDLL